MIYTTTETIPGKEIEAVLGIVNGNVVQSKHIGRDFMAGLKGIVGGELKGYTEMLMEARNIAVERLIEDAVKLNSEHNKQFKSDSARVAFLLCIGFSD
ncbi:TPA: heavy metal-binding domain-containing protein [Vibrio parahaemolyticus]